MRRTDYRVPTIGTYRGCPIHADQPAERIERVVKPEIDTVLALTDLYELFDVAGDVTMSPEARLLSAAMLEARWTLASDERRQRPEGIDLDVLRATVAGLDSINWRSPTHYGSILDRGRAPGEPGAVPREVPLEKEGPVVGRLTGRNGPVVV
jgi:hypothetical protein